MTKEVLVSMVGSQSVDGDQNNVELVTVAKYYKRNGHHFLLYDEMSPEDEPSIKTTLRFNDSFFEMTKKGSISGQMVFNPEQSHTTYYTTPAGLMHMETTTTEYMLVEKENQIEVHIRYILEINRIYSSENELLFYVVPQNKKN